MPPSVPLLDEPHAGLDEPPGTVVSEMAKGYKLNDRLIRPAAVVVAKPRTAAAPSGDGGGGTRD